jgi:hypothetical protein
MIRRLAVGICLLSTMFALHATAEDKPGAKAGLTNPSFEEPRGKEASFVLVETMPGWKTTDTHFEIWGTGFKEVAAYEGTQFMELNAYIDGTLYQDSTGIQSDSVLEFTFAHRGRNGDDTMKLTITDLGADNALDGGDDTVLFTKAYTTGKDAWAVYNSTKEKQIKALGNTVRFAYRAISTATGELGEGNFLDAANFGIGVVSLQQAARGATLTFEWSGRVGNNSSAALGGKVVGDNGWRLNGTPLAADTVIKFSYTIPDTAKDTDGSTSAGRYTEGTLNVSIPSMRVSSAPNKDYHLMFGTDGSSDYVMAQPFDDTGFALVGNWPATADPWPNPNVLSTIANPKASDIFGTSPDSKFTLTLKSGDVLTTAFTELLANPVFSSSSSAKPKLPTEFIVQTYGIGGKGNIDQTPAFIGIEDGKLRIIESPLEQARKNEKGVQTITRVQLDGGLVALKVGDRYLPDFAQEIGAANQYREVAPVFPPKPGEKDFISFESAHEPGKYLRHFSHNVFNGAKNDNEVESVFQQDVTWRFHASSLSKDR